MRRQNTDLQKFYKNKTTPIEYIEEKMKTLKQKTQLSPTKLYYETRTKNTKKKKILNTWNELMKQIHSPKWT